MMKNITWLCVMAFVIHNRLPAQSSKNITKLGQLGYPSAALHGEVSNVWGYVDSLNNEYAIVGLEKGVSIVNVTNGSNPVEVFYVAGASSIWREIKTWNRHAYITNESSGGLMIIDLHRLPGVIQATDVYSYTGSAYPFVTAHSLFIDENGVAYIFGADNGVGGAIFLSLTTDPKLPVELGRYNDVYLHDGMARGDTLWGAAINAGYFAVIDVSSKSFPVTLKTHATQHHFTHNCWISDDGETLFTTDEKPGAFIGSYDVSNLSNISGLDLIQSSPGSLVIPHNTHVIGDFLVTSYYKDGVVVVDATLPENLVQTAWYDTSPLTSGSGFAGCWGAYPWLPSGKLLASDMENGLFVLDVEYRKGAYIQGKVRRFSDSAAIGGVSIECLNPADVLSTNLLGFYQAAYADTGVFSFIYSAIGFLPETLQVHMSSGQLALVDVYLRRDEPFSVSGHVRESSTNLGVGSAQIELRSDHASYRTNTDGNGLYTIDSVYEDAYELVGGKWGFISRCQNIAPTDTVVSDIIIDRGIYDDYTFDFGWTTSQSGSDGYWGREEFMRYPLASSVLFPTEDVGFDCAQRAYTTGVYDGLSHNVDGGPNRLISPVFDASEFMEPLLSFQLWCMNPSDFQGDEHIRFYLLQNGDTLLLDSIRNLPGHLQSTWIERRYRLDQVVDEYSGLQFMITASDPGVDNWLKAAIDYFRVTEGYTGLAEEQPPDIRLYPNPFSNVLYFDFEDGFRPHRFAFFDVTGKVVAAGLIDQAEGKISIGEQVPAGLFLVRFLDFYGVARTARVVRR